MQLKNFIWKPTCLTSLERTMPVVFKTKMASAMAQLYFLLKVKPLQEETSWLMEPRAI